MKRLEAIFGSWTKYVLALLLIWFMWFASDFFSQTEIDQTESIAYAGTLSVLVLLVKLILNKD